MREEVCRLLGAPAFILPYFHVFATAEEMRVVAAVGADPRDASAVAALLGGTDDEVQALLRQAYRHWLLNREMRDGAARYCIGRFYDVLNWFCLFGNYHVLPARIREELDQWCFEEYLRKNDYFRKVMESPPEYADCHNEWILQLSEAEEMIDAASAIRLRPCDCKMLADRCDHSRDICLVLDKERVSDRTDGRDLSPDQAKSLLRALDKEGLIRTGGPPDWKTRGPSVICNCCTCCCYPFRAAERLGTKGRWPKSRFVARHEAVACAGCLRCVSRCPFHAFTAGAGDGARAARPRVILNPELCWGCGLCVSACPSHALHLDPIVA
ncbi:MAG TPA: 4Fe-4S binding protein [Spirochaetia bacterium]|nr:4Fe-4S binding protein [Spirochaetia bacterium]